MDIDDRQLIEEYARGRSEAAFRTLVERHAGLVYGSALRQVNDAQLAEEVAQAVFILLARKAGSLRRGTILSGWLFQTARFVAARALRAEVRRRRREQEAFDMQQLTSSGEAWAQIAPVLDEALAGLGQVDRDAILLRYVEGRSLREVSSALGVTEEAAKKRVTRAVEKLRQRLGRGDAALSAAALTVALAEHASATPSPALLATWGSIAQAAGGAAGGAGALAAGTLSAWRWMQLKWLAMAGATLVAIVAGLVAVGTLEKRTRRPSEVTTQASVPGPLTRPAAGANALPDGARHDFRRLRLRVVSADSGEVVPNAAVFLSVWRAEEIEHHWNFRTDAGGRCDLDYDPAAGRIDVGVMQDGWAARYVTWPSEGSSSIPADYLLKLPRVTNVLGGVVQDSRGNPLANVQIWFLGHEGGDSSHRERPRERFGFGAALPAAETDSHGRWRLGFIPPGHRGFQIEGRHPEFADTTLITSPAQESLRDLESPRLKRLWAGQLVSSMDDAFALTGTVVDERGRPVAGARIQHRIQAGVWATGGDGTFRVPQLNAGRWPFTVTAEGFAPVRTQAVVGPATAPVRVALAAGAVLRIRVVDEDGLAVPEAEVGLEQWGENRHDFDWRARTDFDGRLAWNSAPRDVQLELFARKEGFCYTRDVHLLADGSEHGLVMHRTLEVYGRVLDAETGRAVGDFRATPGYGPADRFHDSELRWYAGSNVRGTNGQFKLTFDEKTYPWLLRLTADGYEDWFSEPLTNRIRVTLDIAMKRARSNEAVRGLVLQPDGTPAIGAHVALLAFDHNVTLRPDQSFAGSKRWLQRTGPDGSFSFPFNARAHGIAAVSPAGYGHQRLLDSKQPLNLTLEPWGRVEGVVETSAARHGVVTVELYDPAADNYQGRVSLLGIYSTKPDAGGRFGFDHVPPGDFCAFVNSMKNIPFHHQTPLTVRPGETTDVIIRERAGTRVTGRFLAPSGKIIDWTNNLVAAQLYADLPSASAIIGSGPQDERPRRELDFWTSAAGREHVNTPRVYAIVLFENGAFETSDNLPPGRYRLTAMFRTGPASDDVASVTRDVAIDVEGPAALPLGDIPIR